MASLNVDLDYFDHPKTDRLIGLLGRGAEVLPLRLWAYCGKYHAESGRLTGHGAQEIESIVGWWGKPGLAVSALLKVKFLEKDSDGYIVHEWQEYQGHIHALKLRASHAAKMRWASYKHAPGMPRASPEQCPIHTIQTNQTNQSDFARDRTRERLQKRKGIAHDSNGSH